jgi:hypothetical protein
MADGVWSGVSVERKRERKKERKRERKREASE